MSNSPKTITLENTMTHLDYHGEVIKVEEYNRPQDVIWLDPQTNRYYALTELCRGTYSSGKKQGQLCLSSTAYTTFGLCPKHGSQHIHFT